MKLRKTACVGDVRWESPNVLWISTKPLASGWRRQKMTPSKRTACDGETERSGGAQAERRIENLQQVGSGDTDTIRPLPRERSIGRDTAGEAATRPDTSHKEGSGRVTGSSHSEISSVARRTLRSVWPDRGALPEVRGRADRVGSLADGQGDRNGPLAPPGAGRRRRSAGSGDVPGPAGGETLTGNHPTSFIALGWWNTMITSISEPRGVESSQGGRGYSGLRSFLAAGQSSFRATASV